MTDIERQPRSSERPFPAYVPPLPAPSVGRRVHYVAPGSADGVYPPACRLAWVTEVDPVDPFRVGLMVVNPTGVHFRPLELGGCVANEVDHRDGGSWHWPERV